MKKTRAFLPLVACLLSASASAQIPGNEIEIRPGQDPGEVTFDATNFRPYLPTPEDPRKFADMNELFDFLTQELNAEPIFDEETGELKGFTGLVDVLDEPCVRDPATETCVAVDSPLKAFLGGEKGYFLVGDDEFCVDESKCDPHPLASFRTLSAAPARMAMATASNDEFLIQGKSYAQGYFYREVGTRTLQVRGGYKRWEEICDWYVLFWYCWDERGWNKLKTETFFTDKDGKALRHPKPAYCSNCNSISQYRWGMWFDWTVPDVAPWTYKGVFGWHWGAGEEGEMDAGSCAETGCYYGP